MRAERLKGHLDTLLLSVLATGPAHGYAVLASLRESSAGVFDLPEGTVYPALHRLERDGLLSSDWAPASPRRRRIYALTAAGASALSEQRGEWRTFSSAVAAVLAGAPATVTS